MVFRAKLLVSAVAFCGMLAILSGQGCSRTGTDLPANAVSSGFSRDDPKPDLGVKHQPTILRAEVAEPPVPPAQSERIASQSGSAFQSSDYTADASPSRHVAELLPITSLDAPPNQR